MMTDENGMNMLIKDLHQRLLDQAQQLDERAKDFDGCSFFGEHPGTFDRETASLLRQAAFAIYSGEKTNDR